MIPKLSQDAILYVEVWGALFTGCFGFYAFIMDYLFYEPGAEELRRQRQAKGRPRTGPLDMFRIYGSFALAVCTAAYAYAYSSDPRVAVPGLRSADSLGAWTVASVLPLVTFSRLCQLEVKTRKPESNRLRLYWLAHVVSWSVVVLVRTDPMASASQRRLTQCPRHR